MSQKIFDGQSADGPSLDFIHNTLRTDTLLIYVQGNLGGGTITLRAYVPEEGSSVSVPVSGGVIEETGLSVLEAPAFKGFARLNGSSGANVNMWIEQGSEALSRIT